MPKPRPGESQKDYMGRCIPYVIKDGSAKSQDQAVAMCASMYRQHRKKGHMMSQNKKLEYITCNLNSKVVREAELEGRSYLVAPVAMMTEGVHEGSQGALLYTADDLDRFAPAWNNKPIVVDHPTRNGKGVSACDPVVLNKEKIGVVLNTHWNGKQRAEAWFDKERTRLLAPVVYNALIKRKMMEVSTGLFVDKEKKSGVFKKTNEEYEAIARNHRPDHLAILPTKKGACSIDDGAGLLQLNSRKKRKKSSTTSNSARRKQMAKMKKKEFVQQLIANEQTTFDKDDLEWLMTLTPDQLKKLQPVQNAEPDEDDEDEEGGDLDDAVKNNKKKKTKTPVNNEEEDEEEEEETPAPVKNKKKSQNKIATINEFVNNAPEEIREVLLEGLSTHNAEKARLIKQITANANNTFDEKDLRRMKLGQLRSIAALAGNPEEEGEEEIAEPIASYFGAAVPASNSKKGKDGKEKDEEGELPIPTMNDLYSKKKKSTSKVEEEDEELMEVN
jgi:hypothetical protein